MSLARQKIVLKLEWTYLNIAGKKSYGCKRNRTTSSSSLRLVILLQCIKHKICEWVEQLKMHVGYASNLEKCVDMENG